MIQPEPKDLPKDNPKLEIAVLRTSEVDTISISNEDGGNPALSQHQTWLLVGLEEFKEPDVTEYDPRDSSLKSTTGCDKKSENSKKNTDDSLEQHQMTDTQTSSFESPLKVDKDWKEKFFYPANHVREVEPKKVRENNDAPIIEDWVSDDEDEVETTVVVKKKTVIPTAAK
ncbi:hypothetical protein Tco_0580176 [Tanacetum coccineum]